MKYKNFVWPHNPSVYTIDYGKRIHHVGIPYGRYLLQDMGYSGRVMRGQGEFYGPKAYETFRKLADTFYLTGPGVLIHPEWQAASAYFSALSLRQEPLPDYVSYTFEFREEAFVYNTELKQVGTVAGEAAGGGHDGEIRWHTVLPGECLSRIAAQYGKTLEELMRLNPQIKNPNRILPGERVRVA